MPALPGRPASPPRPLAIALLAWVALMPGCRRARARIVDVRLLDAPSGSEGPCEDARPIGIDRDALRRRVQEVARRVVDVVPDAKPRQGDYRLEVAVRLVEARVEGHAMHRAFVRARLASAIPGDVRPITTQAIAERRLRPGDGPERARVHVERAIDDVVGLLMRMLQLHRGGSRELTVALEGTDADLRDEAIRLAALRREREAVPALIKLLRSDEVELRDRALGALVEIGDRRAVKPIQEIARLRDVDQLPRVIDAMGALGGSDARAYLEFLISAHEDPETRELARAALARMARSDAGTAP